MSLAGHLKLGRLIVIYDDNKVTIDGETDLSFTEDVSKRFEAYGFHVEEVEDGDNSIESFHHAIERAKSNSPTAESHSGKNKQLDLDQNTKALKRFMEHLWTRRSVCCQ